MRRKRASPNSVKSIELFSYRGTKRIRKVSEAVAEWNLGVLLRQGNVGCDGDLIGMPLKKRQKKKRILQSAEFVLKKMAERGGFEPPVPINMVRRFSKPLPSATQPSLRVCAQLRSDVAEKDTIGIVFCQGINRSMRGLALESIIVPFSINDVSVWGYCV